MKRLLAAVLCLGLVFTSFPVSAADISGDAPAEIETQETTVISGFEELADHTIKLNDYIPEEELIDQFPETVTAYEEGTGKAFSLPVIWESDYDYSSKDRSYYLFNARWDEEEYSLSDSFNYQGYTPYVEVIVASGTVTSQKLGYSTDGSISVSDVVSRAYEQTDVKWTALKDVNGYVNSSGKLTGVFESGETYYGIPYGQPVSRGKYVPHSASISTFKEAAGDSGSVFYTSTGAYGSRTCPYYSSDCSAIVSYSYDLPRMTTSQIGSSSLFTKVSGNSIYNAKVGDCFNRSGYHVELITGMSYNSSGKLTSVEVSQQTPPIARTDNYDPDDLQDVIDDGGYTLLRYDNATGSVKDSVKKDSSSDEDDEEDDGYSASDIPVIKSLTDAGNGIKITWKAVEDAEGYVVYRKIGTGKWAKLKKIDDCDAREYVDTTAEYGVNYTYTLASVFPEEIGPKNEKGTSITLLMQPAVTAVSNTATGVKVAFGQVSGAESYTIYRRTGSGKWTSIGTAASSKKSYIDKKAKAGKLYYYSVQANAGTSTSTYNEIGVKIRRLERPVISSCRASAGKIKIKWKKVTGASGYYILRKTSGGTWTRIGSTKSLIYYDTTATAAGTYYYTVQAYKGLYTGAYNTKGKSAVVK